MVNVFEPREGYNRYAGSYAKDHHDLDAFDRHVFRSLLPVEVLDNTLELGVGDGRISGDLRRISRRLVGVDVAENMLHEAMVHVPGMELVCADLTLPFPFVDQRFNLIVAAFFFVHVPNPHPVLGEVYRILAPGGRFVFNLIPQRREQELRVERQRFKIRSWYHSPPQVEKSLDYHWFDWSVETVSEGKGWISKIYSCTRT